MTTKSPYTLKDLQDWVREAQDMSAVWRSESWTAEELRDGEQWTQEKWNNAVNAGIDPLTINRIFPTINLLLGLQITNRYNTIAKGRTQKDTEIANIMSEGMAFINDQSGTEFLVSAAYKDQIVPGIGWLMCCHNKDDPKKEIIKIAYRDWKEMWFDPHYSPYAGLHWMDPSKCSYVFHQPWMDLDQLTGMFPKKEKELKEYTAARDSRLSGVRGSMWYDEGQMVEDYKNLWGSMASTRKRVRPVEMWYPIYQDGIWAKFANGDAEYLNPLMDKADKLKLDGQPENVRLWEDIVQKVQGAQEIVTARVRRMWTTTFLDDIELFDGPTPFSHDQYPFIPFIGYLDRYGFPFGVPHQMQGQQEEINNRRSMMAALLKNRRVIAEEDVVSGPNAAEKLQNLHDEANKIDGFMVVRPGKSGAIQIIEGTDRGALQAQMEVLRDSERELKEITGANDEQSGNKGQALSGVAISKRQMQSNIILAPLMENMRRSLKIMGNLQMAEIQGQWTSEKVLRITDKMTGADKFLSLNKRVQDPRTGHIVLQNNVTQGKFDIIISEAPPDDSVREQNMNLLIEWAKKSPPEMIPYIYFTAMELSGLPNKEMLIAKLRPLVGADPSEDELSQEQIKQKTIQELEAHKQQAAAQAQWEEELKGLAKEKAMLENELLKAQIKTILDGGGTVDAMKVKVASDKLKLDGFKTGADIAQKEKERKQREWEAWQRQQNEQDTRERKGAEA